VLRLGTNDCLISLANRESQVSLGTVCNKLITSKLAKEGERQDMIRLMGINLPLEPSSHVHHSSSHKSGHGSS